MKITECLHGSQGAFPSLEIVPPQGGMSKDELLGSLRPLMDYGPRFVSVTSHRDECRYVALPDGTFERQVVRSRVGAVAVAAALAQAFPQVEVVPHVICAGQDRFQIESALHDLLFLGIGNIVALRGDSLLGEKRFTPVPGGYAHASELVGAARATGDFCIGVGGYPEKHFEAPNLSSDISRLREKVDAGADYVITQMFFDNAKYYSFVQRCREAGIRVPIIPGVKPLSTVRQLRLLPSTFSIDIPQDLAREIEAHASDKEAVYDIGTRWCIAQVSDLLAHGVPAVHFYTMGRTGNVGQVLKACF